MASITVTGLTVVRGGRPVLDAVDLHVDDGELLAVIGPSGSGKTSLLRAIAGLDRPDSGEVMLGDEVVTRLEPQERRVAMVFQDSVLYPFLTARENVAFPLRVRHRPAEEVELRVTAEGRAMGIEALFDAKPSQLSAGQHQLVQIAKAMVRAPSALLFDEPLAMVDAKARVAMRSRAAHRPARVRGDRRLRHQRPGRGDGDGRPGGGDGSRAAWSRSAPRTTCTPPPPPSRSPRSPATSAW